MIQVPYIVSRDNFIQILLIYNEVKYIKCNHKYTNCNNIKSSRNYFFYLFAAIWIKASKILFLILHKHILVIFPYSWLIFIFTLQILHVQWKIQIFLWTSILDERILTKLWNYIETFLVIILFQNIQYHIRGDFIWYSE